MTDIVMPRLSDSMEQGAILRWLKAVGDEVTIGDELLEIETDKATVVYAAETGGTLEIVASEGTTVTVGEVIARLDASAPEIALRSAAVEMRTEIAEPGGAEARGISVTGGRSRGVVATPVARRIAAAHGLAMEKILGSGPLGRIIRADVLKLVEGGADESASLPSLSTRVHQTRAGIYAPPSATVDLPPVAAAAGGSQRVEASRLQRTIARRMAEATTSIPHFQVQTEVTMDAALAFRAQLKALATAEASAPSLNDLVIKASALALRDHPLANGSYGDSAFLLHDAINVGMAVAADDGLLVPTIFDAAARSLGEIARETRRLAKAVRDGEITPTELEGGTFTVSNLGMFGMTAIVPVINLPQSAILGVGALRRMLARAGEQIVDQSVLTLTLSCDHRILYGADAARFLAQIRDVLESPVTMAL